MSTTDEIALRDICARIPSPNPAAIAVARGRLDRGFGGVGYARGAEPA